MVAEFQHGLIRLTTVLTAVALILAGLAVAAIWMRLGMAVSRRVYESIAVCLLAGAVVFACTFASASWDASESRSNSFSKADESALRQIQMPLRIDVHLAPEDPRRFDLEHHALSKLRRLMPKLEVRYLSTASIGLFEQTRAGYGEIWYYLGGRNAMSRVTTAEGVLKTIYSLAGVAPPKESDEAIFRGHPLAAPPRGVGTIFYVCWPGLVLVSGILMRWRLR